MRFIRQVIFSFKRTFKEEGDFMKSTKLFYAMVISFMFALAATPALSANRDSGDSQVGKNPCSYKKGTFKEKSGDEYKKGALSGKDAGDSETGMNPTKYKKGTFKAKSGDEYKKGALSGK
ncbi:MAG: hypothetical protein O2807_11125, partial [bacterium]|nr:hypothetical protein [bacterium]